MCRNHWGFLEAFGAATKIGARVVLADGADRVTGQQLRAVDLEAPQVGIVIPGATGHLAVQVEVGRTHGDR